MRVIGALVLSMALGAPLSTASAPLETDLPAPSAQSNAAAGSPAVAPPGLADRDGDGLSDSLKAKLDAAEPGERFDVVVTFTVPGRGPDAGRRAVGAFDVGREFRIIRGYSATMTAPQALALARTPGIHRIEEDFQVSANLDGARSDFGSDDAALDFLVDGSGATLGRPIGICVIDTGIDPQHEQLDNGKVVGFFDAVNGLTTAYDDHGHGTHVASTAAGDGNGGANAATYRGVAPGAVLYGAKTLDATGFGPDSDVIAGIEWCADQPGVDILSMSLGTLEGSDGQDSLSLAANCAADPNFGPVCGNTGNDPKIVVIAAGNAGPSPETVGTPGAAELALTVGAVANHSGDGRGVYLVAFSSRGPTLDGRVKPDIVAPGVRITAANSASPAGYTSKDGTSMATPFVSGVVALMLDADPDLRLPDAVTGQLPGERIRDILQATAQDRGPDGPTGGSKDTEYGFGLLDAYAAVAEASGLAPPSYQATRFPAYHREVASVVDGGEWISQPFEVAGDGTPLAATLTIEGVQICTIGSNALCDLFGTGWAWDPDLDMEILDAVTGLPVPATGSDITLSECPGAGEYCGSGRQETAYFLPTAPGSYSIRVYSFAGAGTFALEVSGHQAGIVADAGPDQTVTDNNNDGAESVTLDASASFHFDGTIVAYDWSEGGLSIASGVSPSVNLAVGVHTITMTATDDAGESASDVVVVTVDPNQTPIADAGPDQNVADNDASGTETVTLDASGSSDPGGGTIVLYDWSDAGGPVASGQTVNLELAPGSYAFTLTVIDNGGASATDSVAVTVLANQAPVADAGADQTVTDNDADGVETVTLDGSASSDPGGGTIVTYDWSEGATPLGSGQTLTPSLAIGSHVITLTVTDEAGVSASDSLTVTVLANQTPIADAGPDQTLSDFDGDGAESFTLDAGASSDPGGGTIVSYEWSEGGVVIGSGASLVLARDIGIYSFTLTVTDQAGASATDGIMVTINPDPHLAKVVLLTHLDGPDGATTALDESGSAHALTFAGNAQIDTAQSHSGGASALFDNSTSTYISVADSDDWHFGAGQFTVEAWVRFSSVSSYVPFIGQFANNQISWRLDWTTSNQIRFLYSSNGKNNNRVTLSAPWTPAVDTWYHLAVDRDASDRLRVYVDGQKYIETTVSAALHNSTAQLWIGERHAGWIDDVRITKGVARYQGAFTQPNRPATFDDVVLLSHFDGADGATTAVDESNSNHTLGFAGNAQIDTAQSKFGGASALFDDTETSFVSVADSADWAFGGDEFTVEAWVRFSSTASYTPIIDQADFAADQISWRLDWMTSQQIRFLYSPDGTNASRVTLSAAWAPTVGTWYHLAVDRDSSKNLRVYVDGKVLINTVVSTAFHDSSAGLRMGERLAGWIDDVRITKGAAQYAGSFVPPGEAPGFDDVVLLTHLDGADGATTAVDESNSNHSLSFAGNAQIDTAQSRFGGASALFDNTDTSFISVADSADWTFGGGEFTVEAWVRFSSTASYMPIIDHADFGANQISWRLDWTTSQQIRFLYSPNGTNTSRVTLSGSWAPAVGTWYHLAVDRDASKQLRVYVNGQALIDTVVTANLHDSTADIRFGARLAGWIDEVRITKGVAQYGGAFTPPDQPHPSSGAALVAVPTVTGMDQVSAESTIAEAGLATGTVVTAGSEIVLAGDVISQSPDGGANIAAGSSVDLVVSSGLSQTSVPDVVGLDQASAEALITTAGLVVGNVTSAASDTVLEGDVMAQNPEPWTVVLDSSAVDLVVSSGPAAEEPSSGSRGKPKKQK